VQIHGLILVARCVHHKDDSSNPELQQGHWSGSFQTLRKCHSTPASISSKVTPLVSSIGARHALVYFWPLLWCYHPSIITNEDFWRDKQRWEPLPLTAAGRAVVCRHLVSQNNTSMDSTGCSDPFSLQFLVKRHFPPIKDFKTRSTLTPNTHHHTCSSRTSQSTPSSLTLSNTPKSSSSSYKIMPLVLFYQSQRRTYNKWNRK